MSTASHFAATILLCGLPVWSASANETEPRQPGPLSTATYKLTFESTWSTTTHPTDFPPNPHFSGLIGGTHNEAVNFWEPGTLASDGIESMAETGSKTLLLREVEAAIGAGNAEFVLSGGGIGISPGSVSLTFNVSESFPLVTVVSMVAPSPDWFVGVSGLNLIENGSWRQEVVVSLVVHDAGTDSGASYRSPNDDTDPPIIVSELTASPFDADNVVGTFTFTLQEVVAIDPVPESPVTWLSQVYPNPANGFFGVEVGVDRPQFVRAFLYDVAGRLVRREEVGWIDTAGRHEIRIDGRDLAGQLYFLRITGSSFDEVRAVALRR